MTMPDFKCNAQGQGFLSIAKTAELAGVSNQVLSYGFSPSNFSKSKLAQMLIVQGFEPSNFSITGVPDTAVTLILEYYTFDAGKRCTETARASYRTLSAIGIREYVQKQVGYVPEYKLVINYLPPNPNEWKLRYKPRFWHALEACYGLQKNKPGCAGFISYWVYGWFPEAVQVRLDEINPLNPDGYRNNMLHQHFDGELLQVLEQHIETVTNCLIRAKGSRKEFKKLMKKVPRITFDTQLYLPVA